jgi:hypothetical protein
VPRKQRPDVELLRAVKAKIGLGHILAKQTIGAHDARLEFAKTVSRSVVDDEKMIADFVKRTNVSPHQRRSTSCHGSAFIEKNLETQPLRLSNF